MTSGDGLAGEGQGTPRGRAQVGRRHGGSNAGAVALVAFEVESNWRCNWIEGWWHRFYNENLWQTWTLTTLMHCARNIKVHLCMTIWAQFVFFSAKRLPNARQHPRCSTTMALQWWVPTVSWLRFEMGCRSARAWIFNQNLIGRFLAWIDLWDVREMAIHKRVIVTRVVHEMGLPQYSQL